MAVSDIKVQPYNVTWNSVDLGLLKGDIQLTWGEDMTNVTAHQLGTTVVTAIRTGRNLKEIKITMQETSQARLQQIFLASATEPSIGTGPAVKHIALGTEKLFGNVIGDCQKLVLHPVGAGATDYSQDYAFWLAYPKPDSITLSGEKTNELTVQFMVFPDSTKATKYAFGVIGDHITGTYV